MALQNRIDPFGAIHAVTERGMFTGNRGIIHDPDTKTLLKKRWALHAWLICECEFQGRRRVPMGRNRPGGPDGRGLPGWTELFFLDEVTALAAGHRPCFFCRRERAKDFLMLFGRACHIEEPRAPTLDARLHKERLASGGTPPTIALDRLASLPDGAMFTDGEAAYALRSAKLLRWSFSGYTPGVEPSALAKRPLRILTPATTLAVLAQGYRPVWHPTGEA
jgi:hypothetical protein